MILTVMKMMEELMKELLAGLGVVMSASIGTKPSCLLVLVTTTTVGTLLGVMGAPGALQIVRMLHGRDVMSGCVMTVIQVRIVRQWHLFLILWGLKMALFTVSSRVAHRNF